MLVGVADGTRIVLGGCAGQLVASRTSGSALGAGLARPILRTLRTLAVLTFGLIVGVPVSIVAHRFAVAHAEARRYCCVRLASTSWSGVVGEGAALV